MKFTLALALVASILAIGSGLAAGQQAPPPQAGPTLAEVAKAEADRRKSVRKPAKVYTNTDLKAPLPSSVATPPSATTPPAPATGTPAIDIPGGQPPEEPAAPRDQAYWSGKIAAARTALDRSRMFAEALQSRINALTTDFINRDDPAQKAQLETERKSAMAELDRVRKEMDDQQKAIVAIEDEARRAGVPPGWLRPGA